MFMHRRKYSVYGRSFSFQAGMLKGDLVKGRGEKWRKKSSHMKSIFKSLLYILTVSRASRKL